MSFVRDPLDFVVGDERDRAVRSLDCYLGHFTGAFFERVADPSLFHRVTEKDLVAVTMLGTEIPPSAALWLLGPGAAEVTAGLVQVPRTEAALWDPAVPIGASSPVGALHRRIAAQPGMGRARSAKLLAAKRPHLVPLDHGRVRRALGPAAKDGNRSNWREVFGDPVAREVVADLRADVLAASGLSLLRIVDIVIWMRLGGWHSLGLDPFPPFMPQHDRRGRR